MTRAELIAALETAQGADRGLFEAAFVAIYGPKPERIHGGSQEWSDWLDLHNPFFRCLEANAYLDAAKMLLPVGWRIYTADFSVKGRFRWMLEGPKTLWETDENGDRCGGADWYSQGIAATPANALAAACLRAGGE